MATLVLRTTDGRERRFALTRRITSIGRGPDNDVHLDDPSVPATALHVHFDGKIFEYDF